MDFATPFGRRRRPSTGSAGARVSQVNAQRFAELKPICVELLGAVARVKSVEAQNTIQALLQKLHSKLSAIVFGAAATPDTVNGTFEGIERPPLSLAIINYVFFPVAQLLRAADGLPSGKLPDRIWHQVYLVIADLCADWWLAWTELITNVNEGQGGVNRESSIDQQRQVWDQLLVLSASAFGPPTKAAGVTPRPETSEETLCASLLMMESLLAPRRLQNEGPLEASSDERAGAANGDWDDELDLPSLDDYDKLMAESEKHLAEDNSRPKSLSAKITQVYPSPKHHTSVMGRNAIKGALAHLLMSSLSISSTPTYSSKTRVQALRVVSIILATWVAGDEQAVNYLAKSQGCMHLYRTCEGERLRPSNSVHVAAKDGSQRVSMFLPGVVSGLVGILAATKAGTAAPHSKVVIAALQTLGLGIVLCLSDDRLTLPRDEHFAASPPVRAEPATKLESLIIAGVPDDEVNRNTGRGFENQSSPLIQQGPSHLCPPELASKEHDRSMMWLRKTVAHIAATFQSIAHLRLHSEGLVRRAFSEFLGAILHTCRRMLAYQAHELHQEGLSDSNSTAPGDEMEHFLISCLIDIAADEGGSEIAQNAAVDTLLSMLRDTISNGLRQSTRRSVEKELHESLRSFRSNLSSIGRDAEVKLVASRVRLLLRLISGALSPSFVAFDLGLSLLKKSQELDRWCLHLVGSFEVDVEAFEETGASKSNLRNLDTQACNAVMTAFQELGACTARAFREECTTSSRSSPSDFAILDKILQIGTRWRASGTGSPGVEFLGENVGLNALFIVGQMMKGATIALDNANFATLTGKEAHRVRKKTQRFAKSILDSILSLWQADEELLFVAPVDDHSLTSGAYSKDAAALADADQDASQLQEYRRGDALNEEPASQSFHLGPAVRLDFVKAAQISDATHKRGADLGLTQQKRNRVTSLEYGDVLLLSIVASASQILGPTLKQSLLQLLYPIIGAISSASPRVQAAASDCLDHIAHSAGYASIAGCVLDHADYILGAASHRLVSTLAIELQRHAFSNMQLSAEFKHRSNREVSSSTLQSREYTPLMSAQSAPLVLVELVRMLGTEALALVEDAVDEVLDAIDKFHLEPGTCNALLDVLDRLVAVMQKEVLCSELPLPRIKHGQVPVVSSDVDHELKSLSDWLDARGNNVGRNAPTYDEAAEEASSLPRDEQEATRSQQVTVAILEKALPFVSHPSWTIRLRCLRLLNRGIDILCLQGRTVEPLSIVSSLWPLLMARTGFTLSHVLPSLHSRLPEQDDLDETSFAVILEAVDIIGALAHHLADFLGSEKLLRQALPRLLLLLKIVESADDDLQRRAKDAVPTTFRLESASAAPRTSDTTSITAPKQAPDLAPIYRRYSPLARLIEHLIVAIDKLIEAMGASMTEADLFALATHTTLLRCLDERQPESVRTPAQHLYFSTMERRNETLVWFVLSAAVSSGDPASPLFPIFLQKEGLRIQWLQ